MHSTIQTQIAEDEIFGAPISIYTRQQALADGFQVDISNILTPCPFKYPVFMTRAAYDATIAAGGQWTPGDEINAEDPDAEYLRLPGGQDTQGRAHDVFTMLLAAIRRGTSTDRIWFSVLVDQHGNGRPQRVDLYSVCSALDIDDPQPCITIMLRGED